MHPRTHLEERRSLRLDCVFVYVFVSVCVYWRPAGYDEVLENFFMGQMMEVEALRAEEFSALALGTEFVYYNMICVCSRVCVCMCV